MKKSIISLLCVFSTLMAFSQTEISGTVKDNTGVPIPGANVSILDSNSGSITDFDGKLFFLIFQRPTGKTMRGGSDSEFDGDVILQVEKPSEDYRENYLIARKNPYNDIPMLKYSIYHQKLIDSEEISEDIPQKPKEVPKNTLIVRSL